VTYVHIFYKGLVLEPRGEHVRKDDIVRSRAISSKRTNFWRTGDGVGACKLGSKRRRAADAASPIHE
jgi:hypothetical protein